MAVTVTTQTNVSASAGASTQVLAAAAGRKGFAIQIQGPGAGWVKLGGAAAVDDGFKIGGWQTVSFAGGLPNHSGNGTDFYEGAIHVFYEGGASQNEAPTAVNVRVLAMS